MSIMYVMHNLTDFFFKLKLLILYEIDDCSLLGFKLMLLRQLTDVHIH